MSSVICDHVKTCGVVVSVSKEKDKEKGKEKEMALSSCEHAMEHKHTSACDNPTCLRNGPSAVKCVEKVSAVVVESPAKEPTP